MLMAPDVLQQASMRADVRDRRAFKLSFYPETRFGGFTDFDGTLAFYNRVRALVTKKATVLDVGCGRGSWLEDECEYRREVRWLQGRCSQVIGIDVAETGAQNPALDEFRRIENDHWPVTDCSVDVSIADCVLEHVLDPDSFFAEIARVLRPGGVICIRTVNRRAYVALAARLIPERFVGTLLGRLQDNRKPEDVFPAVYRCNTTHALRRMFAKYDLDGVAYTHEAEPSYLQCSRLAYRLGVWHQRLAPPPIRVGLLAFAAKRAFALPAESTPRTAG
jgi:SAM-dependent methyltransferase